jgi:uncharacterized protein
MLQKLNWNTLQSSIADFHNRVSSFTKELNIFDEVEKLYIDHAGIRVAEKTDVDTLREELSQYGHCFSSEIINGREILLYELYQPLQFGHREIRCIELPYPKIGHNYEDGWEHVEFVIPSEASTLDQMQKNWMLQFPSLDIKQLEAKYRYSEDMPLSESDQLPNPTIAIRKDKNTCIKFHSRPIQEVVGFVK